MKALERFSEPYNATGSLAADGVKNQLGRPDIELLEVLVREAVQNCWDAKRGDTSRIEVEIGRRTFDSDELETLRSVVMVDPPPGIGLREELASPRGVWALYFADFGTDGLAGPTRADLAGEPRDFIDFVRNVGQPPDKDFGGGSFGYGKAAFYLASRAQTVLIDTLCRLEDGSLERRIIGSALGENFEADGRPYTGRHWWGRIVDGVPEPITGEDADELASTLGLPPRVGPDGLGTTVMVVAPSVEILEQDDTDATMEFIGEALAWNFWPRMIDTPGGVKQTMRFRLVDDGVAVRLPDPRTHPRLRGFVEAMDRLREEPSGDDEWLLDRQVECLRPVQPLGRVVIQRGPVAPVTTPGRAVPQGARLTATAVHHVALMRTPEIVVKYLPGMQPIAGKAGYAGVFRCNLDVDDAFKQAEPPTHDDWVHRFVHDRQQRSFVKIGLERVLGVCREAAGYDVSARTIDDAVGVPLGEFADALAALMPGHDGPGARRSAARKPKRRSKPRKAPGSTAVEAVTAEVWVEGSVEPAAGSTDADDVGSPPETGERPRPAPQARSKGVPTPAIGPGGVPVIRYPFELRGHGNRVRLLAEVEIMTNDGAQVEGEPPAGFAPPRVLGWTDPHGVEHHSDELTVGPDQIDGAWTVDVELVDEAMMRVVIEPVGV